jgi:hypothetical protein
MVKLIPIDGIDFSMRPDEKSKLVRDPSIVPHHYSILAVEHNRVVGAMSFHYDRGILESNGTKVIRSQRRKGIAHAMWTMAIEWKRPRKIQCTTVTDRGYTFVSVLREEFPKIKWDITDEGPHRPLRDLRKQKLRKNLRDNRLNHRRGECRR